MKKAKSKLDLIMEEEAKKFLAWEKGMEEERRKTPIPKIPEPFPEGMGYNYRSIVYRWPNIPDPSVKWSDVTKP